MSTFAVFLFESSTNVGGFTLDDGTFICSGFASSNSLDEV
jgi:hypothetical protein